VRKVSLQERLKVRFAKKIQMMGRLSGWYDWKNSKTGRYPVREKTHNMGS